MDWFNLFNEEQIIEWRHWLHRHPEPSFGEYETSAYIEEQLKAIGGIEVSRPTETSVLGIIRGQKPGKTVALRADIDALPVEEETEIDFKSENPGLMHACGHDTHGAMLLGAAKVLSQITDRIEGTVKLVFQHAEEVTPGGAKAIIETGCLDDVDMFYGQHIIAPLPLGKLYVIAGPSMAAQNSFHLTIQGKGSHGSMPEMSIDPVTVGASIVMNLNTIVSRSFSPFDNVVISYGRFSSGEIFNVIPDKAFIDGTVRTNTPETRAYAEERIRQVIDSTCKAFGATYELNYVHGYPALINDEYATEIAWETGKELLGEENCFPGKRAMGSEDFSYYGEVAPSVFTNIGGGEEKENCGFVNHHPKFNVMDSALIVGAKMHVGFALKALTKLKQDI